ncbi:FG-GAP-like repeat-containing protein [Aureisphaera galaxeae]|uniref:FG-GAP-like repeat-containing protein n=1 Tax=Aureisphaera galaxeae TaxID=1538023 RepID=UPI00234FC0A9|nr:FG-GAP-like repeat-containing protein [Aureisphaera galaxeae]MDC8005162.1 FG-GAP-like repeat-containing protein [Aureisphaera galaxeae]
MKKTILLGALLAALPLMAQEVTFSLQNIATIGSYSRTMVDMDGDHLDDIVSVSSNNIQIFFQQDDGSFVMTNITTTNADNMPSWSMAAADYDRNGYTDLLYGGGSGVTFMRASDDGTAYTEISGSEYVFSQRSNFVDINNDGHLDAFVCHDVEPNVYYINDGNGDFTYFQGGLGDYPSGGHYGSVWIDYDNDRDVDLFIAKCGGESARRDNELHNNNGDGTFSEVGALVGLEDDMQTWSSAWADYDNDGDMDAWIGASSLGDGFHRLMRNNGDGTFTDVMTGSGLETFNSTDVENATHDFNNDGYADIASANTILYGNGDLTFTIGSTSNFINGAFGDANNDGFIDVFQGNTIHYNDGNSNNWLKIYTVGTDSNVDGLGARVEITSDLGTQMRDVRSGEGFGDMSSMNTHFGLGSDDTVDITVYWTSGIIDIMTDVSANQAIEIIEGSTLGLEDTLVDNLILYPNPTSAILNLGTINEFDTPIYTIFDVNGRRVANAKLEGESIDVSRLSQGNYILRVFDKKTIKTQRFIKK